MAKEMLIHEKGLVAVLRQMHDELDAAALEALGRARCLDDGRWRG
jgi:hypothetical protein